MPSKVYLNSNLIQTNLYQICFQFILKLKLLQIEIWIILKTGNVNALHLWRSEASDPLRPWRGSDFVARMYLLFFVFFLSCYSWYHSFYIVFVTRLLHTSAELLWSSCQNPNDTESGVDYSFMLILYVVFWFVNTSSCCNNKANHDMWRK